MSPDAGRKVGPVSVELAIVGTGSLAANLCSLLQGQGLRPAFFVDEFRREPFLGRMVRRSSELEASVAGGACRFLVAISDPDHCRAAIERLRGAGVAAAAILPIRDDPALQFLALVLARFRPQARELLRAPGVTDLLQFEEHVLGREQRERLAALDPDRATVGLGYFGRGGGFRRHISGLIEPLRERFNVVSLSDDLAGGGDEAPNHVYLSQERACTLDRIDLAVSAQVHPCGPFEVPKVSFSHVIFDLNLTGAYQAERISRTRTHYLFAASRSSFKAWTRLLAAQPQPTRVCVVPGGYPQLDRNRASLLGDETPRDSILYAPTLALADYPQRWRHSDLVTSITQGPGIVRQLLAEFPDHRIIFRPHPADLRLFDASRADDRTRSFGRLLELCRREERCFLDDAVSYLDSYRRAALLISDTSSTAFTFALATDRPVLFFSPRERDLVATLGASLEFIADRSRVGVVVSRVEELGPVVADLLGSDARRRESIADFRARMVFNPGSSVAYFMDHVDVMMAGECRDDWQTYNW